MNLKDTSYQSKPRKSSRHFRLVIIDSALQSDKTDSIAKLAAGNYLVSVTDRAVDSWFENMINYISVSKNEPSIDLYVLNLKIGIFF